MALTSLIDGEDEPDSDAMTLTRLAHDLGERIPLLCAEKLMYDGGEDIPESSLPKGVAQEAFPVYQRFRRLGVTNMARPIVDAVVHRQRPNGFRLVGEVSSRSTEADDMYSQCRMSRKIPLANKDTALHGHAYYLVGDATPGADHVRKLSPFECYVAPDRLSAVVYGYDDVAETPVERMTLFRLVRSESGDVSVYSHSAVRESEQRTLLGENDSALVKKSGEAYLAQEPDPWIPSNGWEWEGAPVSYEYAAACNSLPVVDQDSPDGMSQISPHFGAMLRIDQGVFDRMCIVTMQAFRQRAIRGLKQTTYQASDPAVKAGMANEGDEIDYDSLFAVGPAALWALPEGVEVWESGTTDITPLLSAVTSDIKTLAASSETPLDILSPDVAGSASGADLKREGIVFKVEALNLLANDALTLVLRMALVLEGHAEATTQRYSMQWLAPELRTWGDNIATAARDLSTVLTRKSIMTLVLGMTEQEIAEEEANRTEESFSTLMGSQASGAEPAEQDSSSVFAGLFSDEEEPDDSVDDSVTEEV